jgi:3-oxoacyl-(acyl-carrier-protein) synthase
MIAIDHGFMGPCFSIASACASGIDAIGAAWMMIRSGVVDAVVTGATEATITRTGVAAFDRVGAMSRRNELPPVTPQPFDRFRDGLVMGEGAAILVLESQNHARQRKANILAEIAGYAATSDAFHITAPQEDGLGGARAMRLAMQAARIGPQEIGYINAHGTATMLKDLAETRAIHSAFGEQSYHVPVSSTKSMTGHMMGATGALETIFCIQACLDQRLPPTINFNTPDPECDLDYVPNHARQASIRYAMNNAFGFGGHNAVLVVKSPDPDHPEEI